MKLNEEQRTTLLEISGDLGIVTSLFVHIAKNDKVITAYALRQANEILKEAESMMDDVFKIFDSEQEWEPEETDD